VTIISLLRVLTFDCVVSAAIIDRIPSAITMRNAIPKSYLPYDLYCNLIPNNDNNAESYEQVPRTGAFEVSFKGHVSALTPHFIPPSSFSGLSLVSLRPRP